MGESPIDIPTLAKLREAFEDSDLPFSVDVSDWNAISENFRLEIDSNYVTLFHTPETESWTTSSIGEFAPFSYGKSLPKNKRVASGSVGVYGSSGVVGHHDQALTNGPTVVIGRKGTVGSVNFSLVPCWPIDTTFYCEDKDQELARFKYYALSALGLERMNTDSAVPGLNRNNAHAVRLRLPPVGEQRRIASALGTLDDRIELGSRIAETLKSIASAMFQAWFVDFEPVRARIEGRSAEAVLTSEYPGHLYSLFPEKLVAAEVGVSPEGWDTVGLDEIAEFTNGLALQKFPPSDNSSLPVIKIAEMRRGITERTDLCSADLDPKYIVENGDLLFSWSGSLDVVFWTHGRGALNQHLFKVTSAEYPPWFCWGWLISHLDWFRGIASNQVTTMGHIRRHHLNEAKVVVPPHSFLEAADEIFSPLIQAAVEAQMQAQSLSRLRNALLPELISGEIRLPDLAEATDC